MVGRRMLWGGLLAAAILTAIVAIAGVVGTVTSPERAVRDYLRALAADDLTTVAALAGLDAEHLERIGGMPQGDAGRPDVIEITSVREAGADARVVTARYGERGVDVVEVSFTLEPAPLGPFTRWRLSAPPLAEITIEANHHRRVTVNGQERQLAADGSGIRLLGFIPSRVEARIDEPYLSSTPEQVRLTRIGAVAEPLAVRVEPSARLQKLVDQEISAFLEACVAQTVLQPTGCPFGLVVTDRVLDRPQWRVSVPAVTVLGVGSRPGVWAIESIATVRVAVRVQRLLDGVIERRDEPVPVVVRGTVALGEGEATITIAPPEQ
jgi:hypothetical protein